MVAWSRQIVYDYELFSSRYIAVACISFRYNSFVRSMLKIKEATSSRSGDYVNEFGRDVYTTDEIILLGRICNIKIVAQNEMFKIFQEEKKP